MVNLHYKYIENWEKGYLSMHQRQIKGKTMRCFDLSFLSIKQSRSHVVHSC